MSSIVAAGMALSVPALAQDSRVDGDINWLVYLTTQMDVSGQEQFCIYRGFSESQNWYAESLKLGFDEKNLEYSLSYRKANRFAHFCLTKDPFDYSFTAIYNWMKDKFD